MFLCGDSYIRGYNVYGAVWNTWVGKVFILWKGAAQSQRWVCCMQLWNCRTAQAVLWVTFKENFPDLHGIFVTRGPHTGFWRVGKVPAFSRWLKILCVVNFIAYWQQSIFLHMQHKPEHHHYFWMLLYTLDHVPVLYLSAEVFCYYPSETILHYVLCVLRMLCSSWLYLCAQASMKKFIQDVLVSSNIVHYPFCHLVCENCFEGDIIRCCVGNFHQRATLLSLDLVFIENISATEFFL